jgi:hypothetical protein
MPGRKRNSDPNLFSTGELALAVNLPPRNVILLCEREDLPIVSGGGGAGQHRLLDITGFAKAVVIGSFADAGLPLSEGVKVANAIWSYRPRQLPQALAYYMSEEELASTAFDNQPQDLFAIIYNGRHLIFRKDDLTIISFPNYMVDQSNQTLRRFYVDPQNAGSSSFSDKKKFFAHLLNHARVQVKINLSQALRRAALQMQMVKIT